MKHTRSKIMEEFMVSRLPGITAALVLALLCACSQENKAPTSGTKVQAVFQAQCNFGKASDDFLATLDRQAAGQPTGKDQWLGCPVDMLSSKWGAPDSQANLPGGTSVLVWETKQIPSWTGMVAQAPPPVTCRVSVTVSATGTIEGLASKKIALFPKQPLECVVDVARGPILVATSP
jgi:hypothetical protein